MNYIIEREVSASHFERCVSAYSSLSAFLSGAHASRSDAGLCASRTSVQLNLGIDTSIYSDSYLTSLEESFVEERSSSIGVTVKIASVKLPATSDMQVIVTGNAANAYSSPLHAAMLSSPSPYQSVTTPSNLVAFPVVISSSVFVYNLPSSSQLLKLTIREVAHIYEQTVTWWNDSSLLANNTGFPFPAAQIATVVRFDPSRITQGVTEAFSNASTRWRTGYGVFSDPKFQRLNGTIYTPAWPQHTGTPYAYASTGVAVVVSTIPNTIGYLPYATALSDGLTGIVKLQNPAGAFVLPTDTSTQAATLETFFPAVGAAVPPTNASLITEQYPLYMMLYTNFGLFTHYNDCCVAQEVIAFVSFLLASGAYAAENFLTMPPDAVAQYVETEILAKLSCGATNTNPYVGYLATIATAGVGNTAAIIGGVLGAALVVVVVICTIAGLVVSRRGREKDQRLWSLEPADIIVANAPAPNRPETPGSSKTSGTAYTLSEMKYPLKPAKMREDGRSVLLQTVALPAPKHWKGATKLFALAKFRQGVQMPATIAKFVGAWTSDEALSTYLVYEFCPKGSLHYVLKSYALRFEADIRFNMAYDVAEGMKYLHEKKIVHGCLSSLMCFVDSNWTVKVSGWMENELSKLEQIDTFKQRQTFAKSTSNGDHVTDFEELIGLLYLEPSEDVTPHFISDVYSFGLLIIEIFTGLPPYKKDVFGSGEMSTNSKDLGSFLRMKFLQLCAPPPALDDFQQLPPILKNIALKCVGSFSRPTFENVAELLNEHRPVKHNIVDIMMEKMDNYVVALEETVEERTVELRQLLHEMLPPKIAGDLLAGRTVPPEYFESVSICFLDICGFTHLSSISTPIEIMTFLNQLWSDLDTIIGELDAYKVDTIADVYMVGSGLPDRNGHQHLKVICDIALTFLKHAKEFRITHRPSEQLKIRLGVHSGSVVAGVVGSKMPQYCIFGDAVNTAARMESTSEPLRIQMSEYMRTLVISHFPDDYQIVHRGEVKVKGKGMMNTFWLFGKNESVQLENVLACPQSMSP